VSLLVSAGEASGDAMAQPVLGRLGVPSFGLGGPLLASAGMELTRDLTSFTAMGVGAVALRMPAIVGAARALVAEAKRRRPRAALLVGFSEFNAWLAPRLHKLAIKLLWYAPPQIWAWREKRADKLAHAVDRMAVILPFEEALWRSHGADAVFVGHPALERRPAPRELVRERAGLTPWAEYVAVLPGSRPDEVRRHLDPMLGAVALLRAERGALDARVVCAPSLERPLLDWMSRRASAAGVGVLETTAPSVLPAFDVALAASGTVTLECVVADVPPVIVYRTGPLAEAVAKRLVRVDDIGLPNIVLGERVFPELLQAHANAEAMADEALTLLDDRARFLERCAAVRELLGEHELPASERVARLIEPWLS
jgi:lipid-A-disaccharide synthase